MSVLLFLILCRFLYVEFIEALLSSCFRGNDWQWHFWAMMLICYQMVSFQPNKECWYWSSYSIWFYFLSFSACYVEDLYMAATWMGISSKQNVGLPRKRLPQNLHCLPSILNLMDSSFRYHLTDGSRDHIRSFSDIAFEKSRMAFTDKLQNVCFVVKSLAHAFFPGRVPCFC